MKVSNQLDGLEFFVLEKLVLEANCSFYQKVLGWDYQVWGDEYIDTDGSGLSSGITIKPKKAPLVVIYRENLEATLSQVKQAGGEITQDIFEFPGVR